MAGLISFFSATTKNSKPLFMVTKYSLSSNRTINRHKHINDVSFFQTVNPCLIGRSDYSEFVAQISRVIAHDIILLSKG